MSCVTIICPNAKRVQVKTTPMMLLRQVLEEACLKSGFDVNSHRLQTQSRKPVDPSLPFRLSGIANNATLEMTQKEVVAENTMIELAIQSTSGRHQKKVGVNVMLSDVLKDFTAEFGEDLATVIEGSVPCIVYMNKRYTGIELSVRSLSSLGVTSGKCLVRHMRVKLSAEEQSSMEAKLKEELDRKKALDANFSKLKAENAERDRLEKVRQEAFDKDTEEREKREQEQMRAILPETENHKESNVMDTSENLQRDVLQEVPQQNPNSWSFDGPAFSRPAPQSTMRLDELNRLLERVDNSLSTTSVEARTNAMVSALADGGRISIGEIRLRAEAAMNEENEHVEVFADPCDRQAVVFKKGAKVQHEEPMETEEFFEVGVEDIRNMQKDLRKAVRDQTQASFVSKEFLVKKNRQLKLEAYQHTVVRINVGDYVLQACFNTAERSSNLDGFLKNVFTKAGWKLLFTNMKVTTSESNNFVDLQLAPKSTLIASFGGLTVDAADVLQNVTEVTLEAANSISTNWLSVNKTYIPFNSTVNEDRKHKRQPLPLSTSPSSSGPPSKSAMPKWMQTGRK